MDFSERAIEASERFEEEQRDRAIQRARTANSPRANCLKGDEFCSDCGEPIEIGRRMALPSATRCIGCQRAHERDNRG